MATATDERLGEMRRRIDTLQAKAQGAAAEAKSQVQRQLDRLKQEEESARESAHSQAAAVDEKIEQLDNDLDIAEHRLAAELAEDGKTFTQAVEAELHDWKTFLERMQAKAASTTGDARTRIEKAIADLRQDRAAVADDLAGAREATGEAWREYKTRVLAKLDELKRKADSIRNG